MLKTDAQLVNGSLVSARTAPGRPPAPDAPTEKDEQVKTRLVKSALQYLLGIGVLAYLIWTHWAPAEGPGLSDIIAKPFHAGPLTLAVLLCLASVLLTVVRWFILVRAQSLPFRPVDAVRLGFIGYFFNTFLPGSVGGDLIKAAFIAREQSKRTVAVATVLIDRAVGLWGLCWLVAILGGVFWAAGQLAGEFENVLRSITLVAAGATAASVLVWFLLGTLPQWRADRFARRLERIPKVGHSAAEFWRAVWIYRLEGRAVWLGLALALVGHVGFVLTFYFSARTLWEPDQIPSVTTHFLIVPVGMAVQAGVPTPGGIGGGEFMFGRLYEWVGFAFANGMFASLVQRAIGWALGFAGYLVYLRMRPALRAAKARAAIDGEPSAGREGPELGSDDAAQLQRVV
jgi:uncharacterized membrane protein YbhN (UPF0104 family)